LTFIAFYFIIVSSKQRKEFIMKLSVQEISKMYGVTKAAVYLWIKSGLPFELQKIVGVKTRKIIDVKDVEQFHKRKEGGK
jgi:predicted DNA-binding protein YlxM (UPF0122 family)